MGKLRPEELSEKVIKVFSKGLSSDVLIGPSIGEDAAVIDLGSGKLLVVHPDPISGAIEYLGFLAIHIPSNDVAVTGAKPSYITDVILLPEGWCADELIRITKQMSEVANSLGISVVGGHTEYAPGIQHPIVVSTAFGITERDYLVRTSGARPGDYVLMTKYVGIEGTAVLATDFRGELLRRGVSEELLKKASEFIRYVSVVREALALADEGLPNSMHDPTEGGLIGGLAEVAYASKCSIELMVDYVPIHEVTLKLCRVLNIDPLRILSSGSLIATVPPENIDDALKTLRRVGVKASIIGRVTEYSGYLVKVVSKGRVVDTIRSAYVEDEVMKLWGVNSSTA